MKLPWNRRREREWQDEQDAHLAMREEWNRQAGMPHDIAISDRKSTRLNSSHRL